MSQWSPSDPVPSALPSITRSPTPNSCLNESPEWNILPSEEKKENQELRTCKDTSILPMLRPTPPLGSFYRGVMLSPPKPFPPLSSTAKRMETSSNLAYDLSTQLPKVFLKRNVGMKSGRVPLTETCPLSPQMSDSDSTEPYAGCGKITWSNPEISKHRVEHGSMVNRALGKAFPYVTCSQTSIRKIQVNGGMVIRRRTLFSLTTLEQIKLDGYPDSSKSGPTNIHSSLTLKAGRYVFVPDASSSPVSSLFGNCLPTPQPSMPLSDDLSS